MKRILIFTILLSTCFVLQAQNQNGIGVRNIINPTAGFNYNNNATEPIEVRVQNDGPHILFAQDTITFSVSIGAGDSTEYYTVRKQVGITTQVGERNDYVIMPSYSFKWENSYVICVTAERTDDYPDNSTKHPGACVSFKVSVDEIKLNVSKVYYANSSLHFQLNQDFRGRAIVYDLTGKALLDQTLSLNKQQQIPFSSPAKGFYFLKIINPKGQATITKFITN